MKACFKPPGPVAAPRGLAPILCPRSNLILCFVRQPSMRLGPNDPARSARTVLMPDDATRALLQHRLAKDGIQAVVAGVSEAGLHQGYWIGNLLLNLLPDADCSSDMADNRVTEATDHFTEFAGLGPVAGTGGASAPPTSSIVSSAASTPTRISTVDAAPALICGSPCGLARLAGRRRAL